MRHTWAFDNETMMCDVLLYTSHGYKTGQSCTVTDLICRNSHEKQNSLLDYIMLHYSGIGQLKVGQIIVATIG